MKCQKILVGKKRRKEYGTEYGSWSRDGRCGIAAA